MKTKKIILYLIIIFLISSCFNLFSNEKDEKVKTYNKEKITLEVKNEFDVKYPLDKKIFYFKKGEEILNLKQFMELSQDPYLLKLEEKIKITKNNCIASAVIFGVSTVGFLIPSVIFIAMQTNYNRVPYSYTITGNVTVALTGVSAFGLIIDLVVFFSLLHNYKYNENTVRQAVERYNDKLREKLGIMPDISFNSSEVKINLVLKF